MMNGQTKIKFALLYFHYPVCPDLTTPRAKGKLLVYRLVPSFLSPQRVDGDAIMMATN